MTDHLRDATKLIPLPERLRAHADDYVWIMPGSTREVLREAATALEAQAAEIERLAARIAELDCDAAAIALAPREETPQ